VTPLFFAMNRFRVRTGNAEAFEALWLGRESKLHEFDGFIEFHMLKGPEKDGVILYASHSVWASEEAFSGWLKSQSFRTSHKSAGDTRSLYEGPPEFEGFTVIQHIAAPIT